MPSSELWEWIQCGIAGKLWRWAEVVLHTTVNVWNVLNLYGWLKWQILCLFHHNENIKKKLTGLKRQEVCSVTKVILPPVCILSLRPEPQSLGGLSVEGIGCR